MVKTKIAQIEKAALPSQITVNQAQNYDWLTSLCHAAEPWRNWENRKWQFCQKFEPKSVRGWGTGENRGKSCGRRHSWDWNHHHRRSQLRTMLDLQRSFIFSGTMLWEADDESFEQTAGHHAQPSNIIHYQTNKQQQCWIMPIMLSPLVWAFIRMTKLSNNHMEN